MLRQRKIRGLAMWLHVFFCSVPAFAGDYPLRYIDRPAILPDQQFRGDVGGNFSATSSNLLLGFGGGIIDKFEVGAQIASQVSPSFTVLNTRIHGAISFDISNTASVTPDFVFYYPTHSGEDLIISLSVPVSIHFFDTLDLITSPRTTFRSATVWDDSRPFGWMSPRDNGDSSLNAYMSVELYGQLTTRVFISTNTGVGSSDFDPIYLIPYEHQRTLTMPFGFKAGATFGKSHPIADITLQFIWPRFYTNQLEVNDWITSLTTSWYWRSSESPFQ